MPTSTVVLVPTYNESGNLPAMLKAIRRALPECSILVIDDDSPDGTGDLADQAGKADPKVFLARRPGKHGLGVAYRYGYRWAIEKGFERIIQMDCDFSHDPQDLPRMERLLETYPVVVGSRRAPGGGVDGWPMTRRLVSECGSLYARAVLQCGVRDLTAGFKGFRREALEALPLEELRVDGFGFQIEVTANLLARGFAVHEMPIRFVDRTVGESKMSRAIFIEAMLKVWQIRRDVDQILR